MHQNTKKSEIENEYEYRKRNNAHFGFLARTGVPYSNWYTNKEKKKLLGKR